MELSPGPGVDPSASEQGHSSGFGLLSGCSSPSYCGGSGMVVPVVPVDFLGALPLHGDLSQARSCCLREDLNGEPVGGHVLLGLLGFQDPLPPLVEGDVVLVGLFLPFNAVISA